MPITTPTAVAALLADHGTRRALYTGDVLFREADASTRVYACISGRIRLVVAAAGGRELVIAVCGPGDVFGDVTALDHAGRSATAVAMEPSAVWELSGDAYLDAIVTEPALALAALRSLARQLRRANARICAGETEPVATRTARMLHELAEPGSVAGEPTWVVSITQTELADWLGTTRESTARALAMLRAAGIITTGRSRLLVHDRDALAVLARPT